jgi:hypothetical protein
VKKTRKHCTAEEKVAILRRHLLEQAPFSQPCDGLGLQPAVFHRWQKGFFGNGLQFFARDFPEFIRIAGMTHVPRAPYQTLYCFTPSILLRWPNPRHSQQSLADAGKIPGWHRIHVRASDRGRPAG